jgi:outer membrane protein assembly factor BamE (lipoprotein component of BamABCDE complex)
MLSRWLFPISIALMLASCSPIVDTRGYNRESEDLQQIVVGQTNAEDVKALLGSPTTTSNFGDEVWYYVTQKKERVGFFAPEVTEQYVTAITFDAQKQVSHVDSFTKEEGKSVQMVSKKTPTEGHTITFIEQLLGNMGRFNAPSRGLSDRNMGR